MTNLLFFPKGHFNKEKQRPLTPSMIKTLILACDKQHKGISFGPQDIKGSMMTLISRGLVTNQQVNKNGEIHETWLVTPQAINLLLAAGIKVLC